MNTNDITEINVHYNEQLGKYVIYCKHTDGAEDTIYCNFMTIQPEAEKQIKEDVNSLSQDEDEEFEEYNEDEETEDEQYERHQDEEAEAQQEMNDIARSGF